MIHRLRRVLEFVLFPAIVMRPRYFVWLKKQRADQMSRREKSGEARSQQGGKVKTGLSGKRSQKRRRRRTPPQLRPAQKKTEQPLVIYSWNLEGKRSRGRRAGSGGLGCPLLASGFTAAPHALVVCECCWKACALVINRRLMHRLISWDFSGRFPGVEISSLAQISGRGPRARC